nr:DUF5753 domain-containing protein [Kibdelosporangium sp. MJ126-NF4]
MESLLSQGHGPLQRQVFALDAKTRLFRVFEPTIVPGTLQTPEYARAVLTGSVIVSDIPDSVDEAVRVRMERQELLYQKDKKFHFVIPESVLSLRYCGPSGMLAQLDRLNELSTLPNVRLGIISSGTQYVVGPWNGFWLRDDEQVDVETYSAALCLIEPAEVALYRRVFDHLSSVADYDHDARAIIARAVGALTAE